MFPKPIRKIDKNLREAISDRPCLVKDSDCLGDIVAHHVSTKGAGGPDEEENLAPLCVYHHNKIHEKGPVHFALKYPLFMEWLQKNNRAQEILLRRRPFPNDA